MLLTELKNGAKVVGAKQVKRALASGRAQVVYLADDADPRVTEPIRAVCLETGVELRQIPGMRALGEACGIAVGAAVAALVR